MISRSCAESRTEVYIPSCIFIDKGGMRAFGSMLCPLSCPHLRHTNSRERKSISWIGGASMAISRLCSRGLTAYATRSSWECAAHLSYSYRIRLGLNANVRIHHDSRRQQHYDLERSCVTSNHHQRLGRDPGQQGGGIRAYCRSLKETG